VVVVVVVACCWSGRIEVWIWSDGDAACRDAIEGETLTREDFHGHKCAICPPSLSVSPSILFGVYLPV
jgi:hypothetical protein